MPCCTTTPWSFTRLTSEGTENEQPLDEAKLLRVNRELAIPLAELSFRFSRASGPGGQNVNKTATRVELLFDVARSPSLSEEQRALIQRRLRHEMDQQGILRLVSQSSASQWRNREQVLARLRGLLGAALQRSRRRVPTRPSRASREKRLRAKRVRSLIKRGRGRVAHEEA
ncbi:MAG: aminoacyl-tRNA hydrolase [Chloroflexi bacterium]|nr:aminoacyl-tRNA hydrolase [Chloroflexota bacterium]